MAIKNAKRLHNLAKKSGRLSENDESIRSLEEARAI